MGDLRVAEIEEQAPAGIEGGDLRHLVGRQLEVEDGDSWIEILTKDQMTIAIFRDGTVQDQDCRFTKDDSDLVTLEVLN